MLELFQLLLVDTGGRQFHLWLALVLLLVHRFLVSLLGHVLLGAVVEDRLDAERLEMIDLRFDVLRIFAGHKLRIEALLYDPREQRVAQHLSTKFEQLRFGETKQVGLVRAGP